MADTGGRQSWVDVRVPLGRGRSLRLVERPGLGLDDGELTRLVAGLRGVADRCVPGAGLRYGVLSGERERLAGALLAIVYGHGDAMIGFSAMALLEVMVEGRPTRVVHAGLAMVDPASRNGGLCALLSAAAALFAFVRNRLAPLWFTNVTQVPAVAGVFTTALADVFPTPERRSDAPAGHAVIAAEIMKHHRGAFGVGEEADFDVGAFVIRNAYTGGSDDLKKSYAACAKHRDARFNTWLRQSLDYDRGDDVLQVGRMSVEDSLKLLVRFVTKGVRAPRAARATGGARVLTATPGARA